MDLSDFEEDTPGVWNYNNHLAILKNKSLLKGCLKTGYKYKSKVKSRKIVYTTNTNDYKRLACRLTSEEGKHSFFDVDYIKFLDSFPGAKWYLLTSEDATVEHGDGGVSLLKFGSRIIMLVPLEYPEITVLTEFTDEEIQPGRFEKLIQECEAYLCEFDVSRSELLETLKKVLEA